MGIIKDLQDPYSWASEKVGNCPDVAEEIREANERYFARMKAKAQAARLPVREESPCYHNGGAGRRPSQCWECREEMR